MTQRNLFPILLVGLPIGLGLSVVAALYLYYNPLDIPLPSRPTRQDAAVFLRRSPSESDLRDYHRILVTDLASRTRHAPDQQRTAANWIASTLGPSNLGLPVRLVESELGRMTEQLASGQLDRLAVVQAELASAHEAAQQRACA